MGLILYILFSLIFLTLIYKLANRYRDNNIIITLLNLLSGISLVYYTETLLRFGFYNSFELYRYIDTGITAYILDTFTFCVMLSLIFIAVYKIILRK